MHRGLQVLWLCIGAEGPLRSLPPELVGSKLLAGRGGMHGLGHFKLQLPCRRSWSGRLLLCLAGSCSPALKLQQRLRRVCCLSGIRGGSHFCRRPGRGQAHWSGPHLSVWSRWAQKPLLDPLPEEYPFLAGPACYKLLSASGKRKPSSTRWATLITVLIGIRACQGRPRLCKWCAAPGGAADVEQAAQAGSGRGKALHLQTAPCWLRSLIARKAACVLDPGRAHHLM